MNALSSLIRDLDSEDSVVRDKAALQLMDLGDPCAIGCLQRAILKPENRNHRGTLVYALGAFNCVPFLEMLVDLALTGNFEVSMGALRIIEETASSMDAIRRVEKQLELHLAGALVSEHHKTAYEVLSEITERDI